MDRLFNFRLRAGLRQSQLPRRGRAELCMILQVRAQAFSEGRSSDRHRRISSISSGGSRINPPSHSMDGEAGRGLRCNLLGKTFFQNRDAKPKQSRPLSKKNVHVTAGDSPKVRLNLIPGCWWLFKEIDCRGSPPLHRWHLGVQTLAGTSPRGQTVCVFQGRCFECNVSWCWTVGAKARETRGRSRDRGRHLHIPGCIG